MKKKGFQPGFTLIELIIVIAIIGIFASVLIVVVDPLEQISRARDTQRITAVSQLGKTIQAYYTSNNSVFPAVAPGVAPCTNANDWMCSLIQSQDLQTRIGNTSYSKTPAVACSSSKYQSFGTTNGTSGYGYCYNTDAGSDTATGTNAIVYVQLESKLSKSRAGNCTTTAWAIFASSLAKEGYWCSPTSTTEPTVAGVTSLY